MSAATALHRLMRRDRLVAGIALAIVAIAAWAYILLGAGMDMETGDMADMIMPLPWDAGRFLLMLAMWAVMMVAMMLPSATPTVLLFASIDRKRAASGGAARRSAAFVAGYLLVWSSFSLFATLLQWRLDAAALLSMAMASGSATLAGLLLLAAGAYQLSPLKQRCLRHCRSPLEFLSEHWRPGRGGAVIMGVQHGLFCLGCCWALMGLLFVGGLMNPLWIAGMTLYIAFEKIGPHGRLVSRIVGAGLLACGMALLLIAAPAVAR